MTENEKYFMGLLSCHINNYDSPPRVDGIDWNEVYDLSVYHHIESVIANEVKQLENPYQPDEHIKSKFDESYNNICEYNKKYLSDISNIMEYLSINGIHHLIINGLTINGLYPMPEITDYNDTSVIVKDTDLNALSQYIESLGYDKKNDGIKTAVYQKNNYLISIGYEIQTINVQSKIYFSDFLGDITEFQGYTHKLKPHYLLLYSLTNLLDNLKCGNATIKMLADIEVILRAFDSIDIELFYEFCEKIRIRQSAEVIFTLCKKLFNSPVIAAFDFEDERRLYDLLTASIIRGSTFGVTKQSPLSALSHLSNKTSISEKRGFFSRFKIKDIKSSSVFASDEVSDRLSGMLSELYIDN